MTRIACVRVEAFAAAAIERCEPGLREQHLAVVSGAAPATRVVEANAHARAAGVRPGLSDAEAGVRCPALVRRPVSADAEAAARHALLDACLSVSPRLEDAGAGLGTRLGPAGLDAHDRASGVDRAPWVPWTTPMFWEEAQGLDYELDTLPALAPILDAVLGRLCARLAAAHLVADALDVRLALVSGGHHTRSMTLAAPLSDVPALAALLALEIEAHPPPAGGVGLAISAHVVPRRAAATDLWQPP